MENLKYKDIIKENLKPEYGRYWGLAYGRMKRKMNIINREIEKAHISRLQGMSTPKITKGFTIESDNVIPKYNTDKQIVKMLTQEQSTFQKYIMYKIEGFSPEKAEVLSRMDDLIEAYSDEKTGYFLDGKEITLAELKNAYANGNVTTQEFINIINEWEEESERYKHAVGSV